MDNRADLNDTRLAPVKTRRRARGRPKNVGIVKVAQEAPGRSVLRFSFAEDIIEKLLRQRDGAGVSLNRSTERGQRMEFLAFSDKSIPAVFVRLAQPSFDPIHNKLVRASSRSFRIVMKAEKIGVKAEIPNIELKTLWIDNPKGLLLIFPDEYMLSPVPKLDADLAFGQE